MAAEPYDRSRDQLRTAILRGEYLPGERLVEAQLCERLGASRFTVRAAVQDLAADGLVKVDRNKGVNAGEFRRYSDLNERLHTLAL